MSSSSSADRFTYVPPGQLPITAQGQSLEIGRVAAQFTGFNAYQLATQVGINAGCGSMASTAQIDSFPRSLRPNSVVRFWAFQGALATNVSTGQIELATALYTSDQAATFHVYLIPVISDQAVQPGDGNHWQDAAWDAGGFKDVYDSATSTEGKGLTPLSYWASTTTSQPVCRLTLAGMWEPMSEAEASSCPAPYQGNDGHGHQTCPNEKAAESALKYFFMMVGAQIRLLDPTHLIEAGLLGVGECGTAGKDYRSVGASPGIDVLSVHDYYGSAPLGGDQRDGMAVRFAQGKALNKPIITGEVGIKEGTARADV